MCEGNLYRTVAVIMWPPPRLLDCVPQLSLRSAKADRRSLRRGIRALVGVDDLAAGGKPDALLLFDFGEGAMEIVDAQRLPDDHGMERNSHDPRLLRAVGVKRLELIHHGPQILVSRVAFSKEERDVVDLHAIRNGEELPFLDLHWIGLIVVV